MKRRQLIYLLFVLAVISCGTPKTTTLGQYLDSSTISTIKIISSTDTIPIEQQSDFISDIGLAKCKKGPWKYLKKMKIVITREDGNIETIATNGIIFGSYKGKYFSTQNNVLEKYLLDNNSFKIGDYRVTPKEMFDFNSLGKSSSDTLNLVACSNYVFYPFGFINDKSAIKASLLKNFIVTNIKRNAFVNYDISNDSIWNETLELQLGINKLTLFLDNDPEASTHSYISKGEILDNKVDFAENVKIGMSVNEFYKVFFDKFPSQLENTFTVVEFESCVQSIKHIYNFDNGKLSSVKFIEVE